jgi:ribosomal protein S16
VVKIDTDRASYWIGKGARPSETVRSLLKQQGAATPAAAAVETAGS